MALPASPWLQIPKNFELKLLSNESKIEQVMKNKKYAECRQIKFWDKSSNFTGTLWVLGDYLVLIMTKQRPHYLVEIHDTIFAHNIREVFKNIWTIIN